MAVKLIYNKNIQAERVIFIDENGKNQGVMSLNDALEKAEDSGMDLVQMSYQEVPVCRAMKKDKYLYELQKKEKLKKKNSKKLELKEIRIGTNISDHDLNTKLKNAQKLIKKGHDVKFSMLLRGRELAHPDYFFAKLQDIVSKMDCIEVKKPLSIHNRTAEIILTENKSDE